MRIHASARTCPNSRRLLVRRIEEEGWSLMAAAEAARWQLQRLRERAHQRAAAHEVGR